MAFPESTYAPPGVYTQTNFESPVANAITTARIPVLIGEGSELLKQTNLAVVRGSSSTADQQVVDENEAGRAVVSISAAGAITLGDFDGTIARFQVRNFPITNGDGTGTTSNSRNAVVVTFNGSPVVVQSVDGLRGIVTLAQAPTSTDVVRCTYYFHRRDTLFTDNVSEQVSMDNAVLYGAQGVTPTTGTYTVVAGVNDTFIVTVLNSASPTTITVTLPAGALTAGVVANTLTASVPGLTASTFVNNFGLQAIQLSATSNLLIGNGTANGLLGFAPNQTTSRNTVFYTFQGPIVDGSGGGITTTDPSKVVVKVNGVQVIPTAVNGTTRAVTLPYAPAPSATVAITYWQNTWQDTFDYLANIGITAITLCGATPNRADYLNGADFVLYNDTIVWGTALLVDSSTTASGSVAFGPNQISGTLVDYQYYGAECTAVSSTQFQLPYQPTTGNGRNSPLGSSLFQSVSNGRIDLPTDRPDLVTAYWGYSFQDALERGSVTVTKVDSATSTITLAEAVPTGATVYATFYYNLLVDKEYLLTVGLPGVGSIGTYTVADADGNETYSATFNPNSKSAGLTGITLNFPSGSEYNAGVRFQSSSSSLFTGPVNELVTVTLKTKAATPAAIAVYGAAPYYFVEAESDRLGLDIDNLNITNANLTTPNAATGAAGIPATLVSSPIVYDATAGGINYAITASNNTVVAELDGIQVTARAATGSTTVVTFVDALNEATDGRNGTFGADGVTNTASNYVEVTGAVVAAETVTITVPVAAGGSGIPVVLTATAGIPVNNEFVANAAALIAAQNLADAINTNSTQLAGVVKASVDNTGVANPRVYIHVVKWGTAGNASTLAEAGLNMTVPAPAFSNGVDSPSEGTLDASASEFDNYYTGWNLIVVSASDPAIADGPTLVGQEYTIGTYNGTTKVFTIAGTDGWLAGTPDAGDDFYLYNPSTLLQVSGSTKFTDGYTIAAAGDHDQLTVRYSVGPTTANLTIPNAPYATATALAAAIQTQLDATAGFNGGASGAFVLPDFRFPQVNCTANADGQLVFTFRRGASDTSGAFFQFVQQAVAINEFAVMAGLDADNANGTQAKYVTGKVARRYTVATTPLLYDRLVLSNRIYCGVGRYDASANDYGSMAAFNVLSQCGITILGGAGNDKVGLTTNQTADAANKATIQPASLRADFPTALGQIGNLGGATDGEFKTVFYDGTGTDPKNNVFEFTVDGRTVSVTFTASAGGTDTPLGDNTVAANSGTPSVISQIQAALDALPGQPFGALATIQQSQMIRRDGVGLRITSRTAQANSSVTIGSKSANAALGFTAGQSASRTTVSASQLVSALMNYSGVFQPTAAPNANTFAGEGIAAVVTDANNLQYLYVESSLLGASSRIEFNAANQPALSPDDALRQGTGLNMVAGTFVTGEATINGFVVSSSNPAGSGSADTSYLSGTGLGQDGVVGQTYVDDVTGLTFTLLPRSGGLAYPANQTFGFNCSSTFVSDSSIPVQLPGVELLVTDTLGTAAGNVATVATFKRGGEEPAIGDLYYVSYDYTKQDFTPALYSRMQTIEAAFGALSPDNPVTLGAYLAILNGAVLVGIAQTQKAPGSDLATVATYVEVLDSLNTPLAGNIKPDIITPLRGDSTEFFQYLSRNVSVQSSIRYQNERTATIGVSAGTTPSQVQTLAQLLGNTRMRIVYPDTATLTLTDAVGTRQEYLVEGYYMAAAMAGNRASPNFDVATPWTNAQLVGFNQLGRKLDAVQQNQTAIRGVTILEDAPPFLRVRHGLTTDMTNILTKLPTIVQIADYVQQNARLTLANFIGIKFLPGVLSQIEGRLAMMFKQMVAAQIVNAYTGIKANVAPDDPTVANVEGFYQPVFPLLYIVITFNLRSSLSAQ